MEEIIEHKKLNTAVSKVDGIIKTKSGQNRKKITTNKRLEVLGSLEGWIAILVPLIELKESYPVRLAEYAKLYNLEEESAFAW